MNDMTSRLQANAGSFRESTNGVYEINPVPVNPRRVRLLRGLKEEELNKYINLSNQPFFQKFINTGRVVNTEVELFFEIKNRELLKGRKREIFFLATK